MKIYIYKGYGKYDEVYVCTYRGNLEKLVAHLKSEFPKKHVYSMRVHSWAKVWIV